MSIARASFANGLRVGFFVALVGPLIGAVVFLIGQGLASGSGPSDGGTGESVAARAFQLSYAVLLFGMLFGALPAALAGAAVAVLTARSGGFSRRTAVVVALVSALVLPVISASGSGEPGMEDATSLRVLFLFYGLMAVISVTAALVCRWLLVRMGWIAPIHGAHLRKP